MARRNFELNISEIGQESGDYSIQELGSFDGKVLQIMDKVSIAKYTPDDAIAKISAFPDGCKINGVPKKDLLDIFFAIKTIQVANQRRVRNSAGLDNAVYSLHQRFGFSPNFIKIILGFFEIKMNTRQILKYSSRIMGERILPSWINKIIEKPLGGINFV